MHSELAALWQGRHDPEPDSPRWHQQIQPLAANCAPGVAILGFACDEGVRRNHGRTGAFAAPAAIRRALANLAWHRSGPAYDGDDIRCDDGDLDAAQLRLSHQVAQALADGHLPLVFGGGHEVAYGSWLGLAAHAQTNALRIGIINFDAHFDLRDPSHVHSSGTPFAQIAEASASYGQAFRYACLGVSRASNTRALFQRAADLQVLVREDHSIQADTLSARQAELADFCANCDIVQLSIDLDVLPACEAPGVSAPAPYGVPLRLLEPLLATIKASGKLGLIELAELNPHHDIDQRTARVAARLVHLLTLDT